MTPKRMICEDCGQRFGEDQDYYHFYTVGQCAWCDQITVCTDPADFGCPALPKESEDA